MTNANKLARRLCAWLAAFGLMLGLGVAQAQTVIYYHTDALGSPVATTDASGNVIERSEYEPYGRLLNRPLTDGPGYTGHVSDAQTGLSYMQQRYYDPQIGRFLSMDPVTANATTGDNFNRYWYANNNPYKFVDPDGRFGRDFDSISKEAGTYLQTPTRSDKDWLGPAIGVSLAIVSAPALAYGAAELGLAALANPATANTIAGGALEAGAGEALGGASLVAAGGAVASKLAPGPFAAESIPARSAAQTFTSGERAAVNKIGQTTGCHTCGTTNPGTKTGNFVPDHQPVSSLNTTNAPQKLYPQCLTCSKQQGLEAARELRKKEP